MGEFTLTRTCMVRMVCVVYDIHAYLYANLNNRTGKVDNRIIKWKQSKSQYTMRAKLISVAIALLSGTAAWADEVLNYNVYDDCSKNGYTAGYSPAPADVEAVDLGLPSGLKWASCNIGANKPEDYGNYYAWDELTPKDNYSWSTYKYANGDYNKLTKYCNNTSFGDNGFTDAKTTLDLEDDAAYFNWGGTWRMPTSADIDELLGNCDCTWTDNYNSTGIAGRIVKSKNNGNSIFLPAAGSRSGTSTEDVGSDGRYWSSSLSEEYPADAWYLYFSSGSCYRNRNYRYCGWSVRPVCKTSSTSNSTAFASNSYVTLTLYADGCDSANVIRCNTGLQVNVTAVPDGEHRHFVRWADGSTDNPRLVALTKDTVLKAEFAYDRYTITTKVNDAERGSVSGETTIEYLSNVTLTATANFGYQFIQWSDGDTNNPRTVVLTKDTTFTAEFTYNQYTITTEVNDAERGSVSGGTTIEYLSNVTLTATANYGYHFARWTDGNTENPRTVEVTGNKTYTAVFEKNTYTITAQANDDVRGSASAPNKAEYLDEITLTATANLGYHFSQWSDGDTNNPRTVVLTKDTTFTAEFAQTFSGQCGDNLYWKYAGHTLAISGSGDMYDYSVSDRPWLLFCDTTDAVVLESGITHIGNNAFNGFEKLNKIELPNTLTSIGQSVFAGCRKLYDIYAYPIEPPVADNSSFANYNVNLYVPCDNLRAYQMDAVFGSFKYIQCITTTANEQVQSDTISAHAAQKLIHNGHVYILRNGNTYTLTGEDVKCAW